MTYACAPAVGCVRPAWYGDFGAALWNCRLAAPKAEDEGVGHRRSQRRKRPPHFAYATTKHLRLLDCYYIAEDCAAV
jgi:hypothetical protein